jgi:hypothetical protein
MLKPIKNRFETAVIALKKVSLPTWGLILSPFLLWLVIEAPRWQASRVTLTDPEKYFEVENKARTTILQGLGGAFFLLTTYIALRNLKIAEDNREIAEKNRQIAEDKQVTERFVKAVEMLADERLEVRLGGIYALERIAKDSPQDHWTIAELLCAYIRPRSPVERASEVKHTSREDIHAALKVISLQQAPEQERVVLRGIDFRGAELENAKFAKATLWRVCLSEVNLSQADLSGATITQSDLFDAFFVRANLTESFCGGVRAIKGHFAEANLTGANFYGADLRGADLSSADLARTILEEADLNETDLRGARNITPEQVKQAVNWRRALYDSSFVETLGLSEEEKAKQVQRSKRRVGTVLFFEPQLYPYTDLDAAKPNKP